MPNDWADWLFIGVVAAVFLWVAYVWWTSNEEWWS